MNHRGTEITERITEGFFDLAQTAFMMYEIVEGRIAHFQKSLCSSVPSVTLW